MAKRLTLKIYRIVRGDGMAGLNRPLVYRPLGILPDCYRRTRLRGRPGREGCQPISSLPAPPVGQVDRRTGTLALYAPIHWARAPASFRSADSGRHDPLQPPRSCTRIIIFRKFGSHAGCNSGVRARPRFEGVSLIGNSGVYLLVQANFLFLCTGDHDWRAGRWWRDDGSQIEIIVGKEDAPQTL